MRIEFKRLPDVDKLAIIQLMNHPLVRRQMPLANEHFNEHDCEQFIAAKERLWAEYGYGPWAFFINDQFAGWGGLQPEQGDADLALVLHPTYWGCGKALYDEILQRAFGEMGFTSVTILFPPTRIRMKGILRLGFTPDGETEIAGERFLRYRLYAPSLQAKNNPSTTGAIYRSTLEKSKPYGEKPNETT